MIRKVVIKMIEISKLIDTFQYTICVRPYVLLILLCEKQQGNSVNNITRTYVVRKHAWNVRADTAQKLGRSKRENA